MKKKIEIEIDLPDYIDDDFANILSKMTEIELAELKGYALGMLLRSQRYTPEQVRNLSGFKNS